MNIHFRLRQQGNSNAIIVLHVFDRRFDGRKFMYSTGIAIDKDHWDKRRDRAKALLAHSKEYTEINKHLDQLERTVISFKSEKHNHESLSRQELKSFIVGTKINERKDQNTQKHATVLFFDTWEKIISESKTNKGETTTQSTRKQKRQALRLVKKFATEKQMTLSFDNIDMNFYHTFDGYMKDKGLASNSRGRNFKEVKAMLREAMDRDIKVNMSFQKKSFKVIRHTTDNTFLNDLELRKLIALKLPPHLEAHRDIFVMACFVGARHSDWHQISQTNIVRDNNRELLKIKQAKTGETIHVPVHPVVRMILAKYNGIAPKVISNQKFNESLKEISKQLELGQVMINGNSVEKWTEVTTHTARRSFATNAYLSKSLEVYQIMKCTGHRTESSFLAYLKLNGRDFAMQAAESRFFNNETWSDILMMAS